MKSLLVCLDGSDWDSHVISYASMMAGLVNCDKAVFAHCAEINLDSSMKRGFQDSVDKKFSHDCETEVIIVNGTNASDILGWPEIGEIDLIIMGVKPKTVSSGRHAAKVILGSLCSVLLVPVHSKTSISKVLLPLDFTENSLRGLKWVQNISSEKGVEVILQHVYFVPMGYSSTGKSYEDFASIMEQNKKKEYEAFKRKNDIKEDRHEIVFSLDEDHRPSDKIYDLAQEKGIDLMILGSMAKTKAASMLLFSTSIGLLKYDEEVPLLIVRDKEESIGFFEALMRV